VSERDFLSARMICDTEGSERTAKKISMQWLSVLWMFPVPWTRQRSILPEAFIFLLYQFIRLKYANVDVVFIAHTTTAKEVSEDEFFHRGESGGTYISSGYEKALEISSRDTTPTVGIYMLSLQ